MYPGIDRSVSGRIGDYSRAAALLVGSYQREGEKFKRVAVYSVIDEKEKWNAPHPKFTSSGGRSPDLLHHLRHIFYKYQEGDSNKVKFVDENKNCFILFMLRSGDVLVGVQQSDGNLGAVVSFREEHPLYQDLMILQEYMNKENKVNTDRNPFFNLSIFACIKPVNIFQ